MLAAGAVLMGIPADAQIRPDTQYFRWSTRRVTINIKPSDYDLQTMTATVTIPRAITGHVRPRAPWYMLVRADPFFELKREGVSQKPCSDMAIHWTNGPGGYRVLSSRNQLIAVGADIQGEEEVAFDLTFAAKPGDLAGEYSIELYFQYSGSPGNNSFQ